MLFPPALQRFDTTNLRLRMMSAALMAPGTLLAVWLGGKIYGAVITAAVTIGLYEWLRLMAPKAHPQTVGLICSFLVVSLCGGVFISPAFGLALGIIFTLLTYFLAAYKKEDAAHWIAFGLPYMGGSGLALLALRQTPGSGRGLLFFLLIVVWCTDIGAFAIGKAIGGAKLAPGISPNKTWAGFFGGIAFALLSGYAVALLFGAAQPDFVLIFAPLLSVVSQAGDLFESYFKRLSGVKESGDLIPGHGGVLDRIDGLVFAGVFAYLVQAVIGINWW